MMKSDLVEQAFHSLYPEKSYKYSANITYSGRFRGYNASVRYTRTHLEFRLSKLWKEIDKDIVIGLIQELMIKIFKDRRHTINIDFYLSFLKKVHIAAPRIISDPELIASFIRVNETHFYGLIDQPNLKWGSASFRKVGSYEYGTDTITISTILRDHLDVLDYVMYHEVLHKKHKFSTTNGRTIHHSKAFRKDEARYPNAAHLEQKIRSLCSHNRLHSFFT